MSDQQVSEDLISRASVDRVTYGISKRDYQAYRAHYNSAKKRKIPFRFKLLTWVLWWQEELRKIGPDAKRGRERNHYVMARKSDRGAYEPGNVRCVKPRDNAAEVSRDVRAMAAEKAMATMKRAGRARGDHLKVRGDGHPRSKAVITPAGRYGSIALAAEAHGITRAGGFYRVDRGEWRLEV